MSGFVLDPKRLIEIPPQPNRQKSLMFYVNPSGEVSMSKPLREAVQWERVIFSAYDDGSVMAMREAEENENSYYVPKQSGIKAGAFMQALKAWGVKLRAQYMAEWNESEQKWVGVIVNGAPPKKGGKKKKLPSLEELV